MPNSRLAAVNLKKIKREHILRAIADLNENVPHGFADSTGFDLLFEGKRYAPKAVLGVAGRHALGMELLPEHFSGGEDSTCFKVLRRAGFDIVPKHRAYLLTWNPDQFSEADFKQELADFDAGTAPLRWSVGHRKDMPIGSDLFLMRLGREPKGIVGTAVSNSEVHQLPHWDPAKAASGVMANYVLCRPKRMQFEPILPLEYLNQRWPGQAWTPQGSGVLIEDDKVVRELALALRLAKATKYWWVNHKQTYKAELDGGYIWSPKTNADGSQNQTYLNLTLVSRGDVVLSYAEGIIQAIGVVSAPARESAKPTEFGSIGDAWAKLGWEVPIDWQLLQVPIIPKNHLADIAPLLPAKYSPIKADGNGNQGCYLAGISATLGELLLNLSQGLAQEVVEKAETSLREAEDERAETEISQLPIPPTEKEQLIKARRGQGRFRLEVEKLEQGCRLTKLTDKRFLIASHSKPWCEATNQERLDGANGLLLAPHADKLYDGGWITFQDDGQVLCVSPEIEMVLVQWGIKPNMNVGGFTPQQREYLKYHREFIYGARQAKLAIGAMDLVRLG